MNSYYRTVVLLLLGAMEQSALAGSFYLKAEEVLVDKSDRTLYLLNNRLVLAEFPVVFGPVPVGPKMMKGDEKTPEGVYILGAKKPNSRFYKSIHISYPNSQDIMRAEEMGVDPGGQIMIHGLPNGNRLSEEIVQRYNWTDGCIAVSNQNMDIIWNAVDENTPIEIRP